MPMLLATDEEVRLARRANIHGSLALNGALLDKVGPRLNYAVVMGSDQWYVLHCVRRAAKLYRGDYLHELISMCADNNEGNIDSDYDRLFYLMTTGQVFGREIEQAMSSKDELGFYVATQVAEAAYDAQHCRAAELAIERLERGFSGPSLMHRKFELGLATAFYDNLCGRPVDLSGLLVIMSDMDSVQRQRANMDLDRFFNITWEARTPGKFK